MDNWSISKRIKTISQMMMAAIVLVALVSIATTLYGGRLFEGYRTAAVKTSIANDISKDLFEAQLSETEYRRNTSAAVIADFRQNIDMVHEFEVTLAELVGDHPAMSGPAQVIGEATVRYNSLFDRVVSLQADRDRLVATLYETGSGVLESLNRASTTFMFDDNQRLITLLNSSKDSFLQGQTAFDRFLLTNSREDFDVTLEKVARAQDYVSQGAEQLAGTERAAVIGGVASLLDAFRTTAIDTQGVIATRNALRLDIDNTAKTLHASVEMIVDSSIADSDMLKVSTARAQNLSLVVLIVLSALGVAAVALVSRTMARSVSESLETSVTQMSRLADGDLGMDITGAEANHELGEMARALQVFRDNALAARALEEETRRKDAETRAREVEQARAQEEAEKQRQAKVEDARRAMIAELRSSVGAVVDAGAAGDFSHRITVKLEEPELQALADGVNRLVENVDRGVNETATTLARLATGDFSAPMEGSFQGTFAELKRSVNDTIENLGQLVVEVSRQCDGLGTEATSATDQSIELARRAEQQATSLEETSAAMEEISASARSSADGASHAADFANTARERVDAAGQIVASAVDAMGDISEASDKIGEIVSVIDGIAFQTNLLALNASVEAARAGTAGKGFAVVATEVRALAQRSSEASQDIKTLIEESSSQVRKGVDLVEQTGKTLDDIMGGVREMASTMQELTTTAREQASGVGEVTTAISQLDMITQKNAALSEQSRENAGRLKRQAEQMRDLLGTFRTPDPDRGTAAIAAE